MVPKVEIMISGFPASVLAGRLIKFVIDGIKMNYAAGGSSIPLELYTIDGTFKRIESFTFYDWVSPVTVTTVPSPLAYVKIVSSNVV